MRIANYNTIKEDCIRCEHSASSVLQPRKGDTQEGTGPNGEFTLRYIYCRLLSRHVLGNVRSCINFQERRAGPLTCEKCGHPRT